MKNQGLRAFWSRFLDSRAPVLFIIGSIFLAILGNASYAVATLLLGDQPLILLLIAVLALVGSWLMYRAVLRITRGLLTPQPIMIATEAEVQPQPVLVVLVSPQPNGPEEAAINHHQPGTTLQQCWLIASRSVVENGKAADLQYRLLEQNVRAHVVSMADANQARESFEAVGEAIRQAVALLGQVTPVVVDITGGTKPMSAGAAFACQALGVPMQYMVTPRRPDGTPNGPAQAMQVRIDRPLSSEVQA